MRKFGTLLTILSFFLFPQLLRAQITITTPYPVAAQSLTRGLDTSLLTVQVNFLSACTGNVVTIGLPSGVTYIGGSVTAIAGSTTTGYAITDNGGTASQPKFSITGVASAGSIRFTVKRTAGCGSASSGKDTVSVSGSCGSVVENAAINTYNLLSPALSITPPTALSNVVVGGAYSRNVTITNGGLGCVDTVRYFVVYPSGGIINTATGNAITVGSFSFTPYATNGDTLFYKICGATVYSGSNLLCNGGTVTITEPIKVRQCSVTTTYGARWGKTATAFCQTATGTSSITMATGVPNITVLPATSTIITATNMCNDAVVQAIITNNGTESTAGAGTAFKITQLLGIDNGENINVRSPLIISNVQMSNGAGGWVPLTATGGFSGKADTIRLSQLTSDPDGAGGLTDADGDGQYNDLPVGQSITIRYNVTYTCQAACATSSHSAPPTYQATFQSQCGTAYLGTKTSSSTMGGGFNARTLVSTAQTGATDLTDGQTATMRISAGRDFGVGNTTFSCPTDQVVMRVILPKGFSATAGRYYPSSSSTTANTISVTTLTAAVSTNPDTAVIIGKRLSTVSNDYSAFAFEADIKLTCANYTSGATALPYTISYICDASCSCQEQWFCGSFALKPHCNTTCPNGGLTLVGSQFRRSTTGYTTPYSSVYADTSILTAAQRRYVMPYDTVQGFFPGVLKPGTNGLLFTHHYFEMSYPQLSSNPIFTGASAVVRVRSAIGGTVTTAMLAAPLSTVLTSGRYVITYDVTATGLIIASNDSVTIYPYFSVLNNAGLATSPAQLSGITTRFYSNIAASTTQYNCDDWSGELYISQPLIQRNDGTGGITNNGCATYTYNGIIYYNGPSADVYPKEVRPYLVLDSIRTYITSGDTYSGSYSLTALGNVADGYNTGNKITTAITPTTISSNGKTATFVNTGGAWPKADYVTGNSGSGYNFAVGVTNGCGSVSTGTFGITYYYKKYAYAHSTAVMVSDSSFSSRAITNNVAALALSNLTGTVQGVSPQQTWDVRIANTTTYTAPYLWMALDNEGRGISVDSVKDLTSNTLLTTLTYGTGKTWYQMSTAGLTSGANRQARVFFHYTSCSNDSIRMLSAWNCTSYPTDPTAACTPVSQYLKVAPQPSQVQISIARQAGNGSTISLCTADSVTVVVNSAQAGNLINPYVTFYPPTGITLTTPIPVEYPLGSGTWQSLTPVALSGGGYQINLSNHTGIGTNGLPGTSLNPAAAGRQAKLKFAYNATCSFISGTQFTYFVYGNQPCGSAATGNGLDVQSNPVQVTGATTSASAVMGLAVAGGSTTLNCGTTYTLNLRTTPVGTTTAAGDSAIYSLPAGTSYTGSFSGCATCTVTTAAGSAGTTLVKVALPTGVTSGTPISYNFNFAPAGSGCSNAQITGQTVRTITGLFCGATACGNTQTVIGTATPASVTVSKPSITITGLTVLTPGYTYAPGSTVPVKLDYQNNGAAAAPANTYIAELYCNASATTPFATHTLANAVAPAASASDTFNLYIPVGSCVMGDNIVVKVPTTTNSSVVQCICSPSSYSYTIALPVVLKSFTASASQCILSLQWEMGAETGIAHYELQYSSDGVHFTALAQVPRNSNGSLTYGYTSKAFPGTGYYRLTLVGTDGSFTYSGIVQLQTDCKGRDILFFPNPVQDIATISGLNGGELLNVYNTMGELLLSRQATGTTELLSFGAYPAGAYHVVVVDGDGSLLFKATVTKQ